MMLRSAHAAETTNRHVCSDAGIPVYFVKIGTAARLEGNIKQAISDGFDHLVATIDPPILKHVTNPLTNERGYKGKDMPIVSYDLIDGADYVEIICSAEGAGLRPLGGARNLQLPDARRDREIRDGLRAQGRLAALPAGRDRRRHRRQLRSSAPSSPRLATLRPFGQKNPEPILADMEERLLKAVNKTGFGPMGTGGDTTALAVHIEYASGPRLHAGRGVLQLLDQPPRQRAHLQQRRDRPFRIEARPDGRHASSSLCRSTEAKVRTLSAGDFVDARRRDRDHRRPADAPAHPRAHRRRQAVADRHHRRHALPSRQLQPRCATARSRCST